MKTLSDDLYRQFSNFLAQQSGIVLGDNKQYLVKSRLSPLMTQFGIESLSDLVTRAMSVRERELKMAVVDAMTTNETLWFRDTYPFQLLSDKIFPELGKSGRPIKIWSAASSSGQEPYSIAMTALEQQVKRPGTLPGGVQIVGTDISSTMLNQCKEGCTTVWRWLAVCPRAQATVFEPYGDNKMRVVERVRKLTTFRPLNLLESYSLLGKFDIIFCRNVLIYLRRK
jgi:chemotaxis protein methyltransferase CheR